MIEKIQNRFQGGWAKTKDFLRATVNVNIKQTPVEDKEEAVKVTSSLSPCLHFFIIKKMACLQSGNLLFSGLPSKALCLHAQSHITSHFQGTLMDELRKSLPESNN